MSDGTQKIYVRAYTVPVNGNKDEDDSRRTSDGLVKWPNHALVFDSETRITADLTLTFGFWRFCELRDNKYECSEEGIFHDDNSLTASEFELLREYANINKPNTTEGGCNRLRLYSRSKFIQEVLGIAIQARSLI